VLEVVIEGSGFVIEILTAFFGEAQITALRMRQFFYELGKAGPYGVVEDVKLGVDIEQAGLLEAELSADIKKNGAAADERLDIGVNPAVQKGGWIEAGYNRQQLRLPPAHLTMGDASGLQASPSGFCLIACLAMVIPYLDINYHYWD